MMWPHVTNFDLFLSSHQKKFCGWSIGVSGLVTGLSSKVHKELRIGATGLPLTPATNSSYSSYQLQLLKVPNTGTPVTNSSYSSYQIQLLQLPTPVTQAIQVASVTQVNPVTRVLKLDQFLQ